MNIFVLDKNINKCAQYHCDQHVVKMILESAQILCTALSLRGYETPYKPTHEKHPCVLWAKMSYSNFKWLSRLAYALNSEYRYRYSSKVDHKSISVVNEIQEYEYKDRGLTEFVQAMPEEYRVKENAVKAYRNFYNYDKSRFAVWSKRHEPDWFKREYKQKIG
ncbi:MAG: hypothetical protein KGY75_06985 [Candidatus Cloacimonetes bacterium]|nr:hypothetical protein [Candidatus Cloacimonadota bacterium]MBS3767846.1 hypothetical protein [Candidatus Cloacimonadota bacterium]